MNSRDSEIVEVILVGEAGYMVASKPQEVDVIFFDTCSVKGRYSK
ncbi:MAG: hypothetical protein JW844_08345 [Candidatus Omnitrophica bacterium]|nr:hypothetical protein [Candidatus Omnitrophota bacterium]